LSKVKWGVTAHILPPCSPMSQTGHVPHHRQQVQFPLRKRFYMTVPQWWYYLPKRGLKYFSLKQKNIYLTLITEELTSQGKKNYTSYYSLKKTFLRVPMFIRGPRNACILLSIKSPRQERIKLEACPWFRLCLMRN